MKKIFDSALQRMFDLIFASLLLLLLSPLCLLTVVLLMLFQKGSCLFIQIRPGWHGRLFRLIKFKTMRDSSATCVSDAARLTPIGRIVRRLSLDELPQLLNVIKGEMSLVGPRPLLEEYLPRYTSEQFRRHAVKPGITGWAQINGRNGLSWEARFELDLWYVDHASIGLYFKILAKTFLRVIRSEGIQHADHVTMVKFTGTKH